MAKLVTFFDTETTGLLPKYYSMDDISRLPHLVQLGAIMVDFDNNFEEVETVDVLVKPNGYEIPTASSDIHGIKHEYAVKYGQPLKDVVGSFRGIIDRSVGLVAHNMDYDSRIMALSYIRSELDPEHVYGKPKLCTMKAATPVLNLPGMYGPKWPKLEECVKHFFDEDMVGAHDALTDIRYTLRIFKHMRLLGVI